MKGGGKRTRKKQPCWKVWGMDLVPHQFLPPMCLGNRKQTLLPSSQALISSRPVTHSPRPPWNPPLYLSSLYHLPGAPSPIMFPKGPGPPTSPRESPSSDSEEDS